MKCLVWKKGYFYCDTIERAGVVPKDIEVVVAETKADLLEITNIDYLIVGESEAENTSEIVEICELLKLDINRVLPCAYLYYLHKRYTKYEYMRLLQERLEINSGITVLNNWTENKDEGWKLIIRANCLWKNLKINFVSFRKTTISICNFIDGNILFSATSYEGEYTLNCKKNFIIEISVNEKEIPHIWIETEETALSLSYNKLISRETMPAYQFKDIMEQQTTVTAVHEEDYFFLSNFYGFNGTILDVGGNYGQSIYSFMELTDHMKVISIEANPDLWEILDFYSQLYPGRVQIIKNGVSEKEETIKFYKHKNGGGIPSGSFLKEDLEERLGSSADIVEELLTVSPIDSMVKDSNIWLCKLDIEGLELKALKGMTHIIEKSPIFMIEQNGRNWKEILYYMDDYECYFYDWNQNIFTKSNICNSINYWLIPKKGTEIQAVNEILAKMNLVFDH